MNGTEVELTPLGGVGEFGKNCLLVRAGGETIIIDAGISFPDESLPGVDRVAPDFSGLTGERVSGIFLTHGHEDHIGALPLLLEEVAAPVFATPFTGALARRRVEETGGRVPFQAAAYGRPVSAGAFTVTFHPVSHSVPQSAALSIEVLGRKIFHSGDFKIDADSPVGESTDLAVLSAACRGCDLLLLDSTNADRPGACPSESEAREGITREVEKARGRALITTFSSHVARIQGAASAAARFGRRVSLLGRSLREVAEIAEQFGYLSFPAGMRTDRASLSSLPPERLLVVCAGSQGEPLSALHRLSLDLHSDLKLSVGDLAIFSARAIPGREQPVSRVVDHLLRRGAVVRRDEPGRPLVHVSGHAYRGDLGELVRALDPKFVLPVHGQRRALAECAQAAVEAGVPADRTFLLDNGDALFLSDGVRIERSAHEARAVFLDAALGAEIEGEALRERRLLGSEGLVVVIAAMSARGPQRIEVVSRGLAADSADVAFEVAREVNAALSAGSPEERLDPEWARSTVSSAARRLCRRKYGSRPMVVPIVAEG
jgi:ribonuclease J